MEGRRSDAPSPSDFGVELDSFVNSSSSSSSVRPSRGSRENAKRRAPRGVKEENFPSPSHFGPLPTVRTLLAGNGRLETACRVFGWLNEEDNSIDPRYETYTPEQVKLETLRRMELFMSSAMMLYHYQSDPHVSLTTIVKHDLRVQLACDIFGWLDEDGILIPKYERYTAEQVKSETMRQMETVVSSSMLLYLHSTKTDEVRRASEGELDAMWALHSWKTSAMKNEFALRDANARIKELEDVMYTVYVKEQERMSTKAKKLISKTLPREAVAPEEEDSEEMQYLDEESCEQEEEEEEEKKK